MTNEQTVMDRISNNRFLGKSSLEFRITKHPYETEDNFIFRKRQFEYVIEELKGIKNITNRVRNIIQISENYRTYFSGTNRFQCKSGARRSTIDIWRVYKNYFEEVDVFTIMRALYVLVKTANLNTNKCDNVRKRVYWIDSTWNYKDYDVYAELGVPLREWENIGLNQNEQT